MSFIEELGVSKGSITWIGIFQQRRICIDHIQNVIISNFPSLGNSAPFFALRKNKRIKKNPK